MRSSQRKPRVSRLGRFVRGWRPDRNPLRRASDRVETVVLALLAVAFLAAAPFVIQASGAWTHAMAHHVQLAQQASRRQVPATLVKVTPAGSALADGALPQDAQARWTAPDGKTVTGDLTVPAGTVAGATVQVWTTQDGQLANPPLQNSQVAGETVCAEVVGVLALGTLLTVTGLLARRALNKRRMAAWDSDWRATGPHWTTRA